MRIDTSFETRFVIEVRRRPSGFELLERPLERPRTKSFPLDLKDASKAREWERTWLALDRTHPVGVVGTQYERWNRRVIVRHLYVSASHRRQGIARRLLDAAMAAAREDGAVAAWLETSSLNVPGIRAYARLGFQLCGFDTSLYDGTAAKGEVAIFLHHPLAAAE